MRASILGGSGYAGGELLRLLLWHPEIEVAQVTSESMAGEFLYAVHPNLRGHTKLKFTSAKQIEPVDILFLALPHGEVQKRIDELAGVAERIVDLSGDFRLRDPALYEKWYGHPHAAPAWLDKFVYGLPELHREELRGARYASGVGCNATSVNLAVYPCSAPTSSPASAADRRGEGRLVGGGNKASPDSHQPRARRRDPLLRSGRPLPYGGSDPGDGAGTLAGGPPSARPWAPCVASST